MYNEYDELVFFNVSKVLSLYKILVGQYLSADEMIQEIGFLFEGNSEAIKKLKATFKVIS